MPYKNKEEGRANAARYRRENKEKLKISNALSRSKKPEKYAAMKKEWKHNNREKVLLSQAAYRDANREELNAKNREYQKNNPSVIDAKNHRRRASLVQAEGNHTAKEWEDLCEHYDYTCLCCGKKEPEIKLTADHVIPLSKKGKNSIDNIQPLCGSCNFKKHTKTTDFRINFDLNTIQEAERGNNT